MSGLAELAAVMMGNAQRRIDAAASNVSNVNTPAYRARHVFSQLLDVRDAIPVDSEASAHTAGPVALKGTGNALDVATDTSSVLLLREGAKFHQSRSAQLSRDAEGRLVDPQGRVLQAAGGGDVILGAGIPVILKDGTITLAGQPEARIGLFQPAVTTTSAVAGGELASLPDAAEGGVLHQGMVVPSDVDLGSEMIELNHASRTAETGAKVFQLYDDLLGRVSSLLGEVK